MTKPCTNDLRESPQLEGRPKTALTELQELLADREVRAGTTRSRALCGLGDAASRRRPRSPKSAAARMCSAAGSGGGVQGRIDPRTLAFIDKARLKLGDVVIMDDLGFHKVKEVRESIRNAGARPLFRLPRPEPDRAGLQQAQAPDAESPLAMPQNVCGRPLETWESFLV